MAEISSKTETETLRGDIASANGFELYKRYAEADAAGFIGIHAQTLKQLRLQGRIQFLRVGARNIAYFGFQIADYLIGSITWAKNPNPSSSLEIIGSGESLAETPGIDTGGTQIESATAAHRLAQQTLKKPKTS